VSRLPEVGLVEAAVQHGREGEHVQGVAPRSGPGHLGGILNEYATHQIYATLPIMDAGVAAVLGAVVGVAGTMGAAALGWLSARSQLRAQRLIDYGERRRQARRDAYAAFLEHLSKVRVPLMESLDALDQPLPDVDAILRRLEAAQHEAAQNDSISYVVMLEGPAKVAEIATGTMEAISALNGIMREHCKCIRDGKGTAETRHLMDELGEGIGTYGAAFLASAREALELEKAENDIIGEQVKRLPNNRMSR
jgi:hypothetical protein